MICSRKVEAAIRVPVVVDFFFKCGQIKGFIERRSELFTFFLGDVAAAAAMLVVAVC